MIDRIRKALCLQTESTIARVWNEPLAVRRGVLMNEVTCIQLNAGLGGQCSHGDSGDFAFYDSNLFELSFCAAEDHMMVVTSGQSKLLIIGSDVRADRFLSAEIKRCTLHTEDAPCGKLTLIELRKAVGMEPHRVVKHIGAVLTVEVEVGMIGEVDHGVLVAHGGVLDLKRVVLCQTVQHLSFERAGIALLRRWALKAEFDRVILDNTVKKAVRKCAVKMILALILVQTIDFPVQGERGVFDAVRVPSDERAEKAAALFIIGSVIIAESDIPKHAVPIGHEDALYGTAVVEHGDFHPVFILHDKSRHVVAVCDHAERLCVYLDHRIVTITYVCACCSL